MENVKSQNFKRKHLKNCFGLRLGKEFVDMTPKT